MAISDVSVPVVDSGDCQALRDLHSELEERFATLGRSQRSRLLVVVHLEAENETIRIVSARKATPRERHAYTEEN